MADWLYAGPSVALRAWPTWVWVRPRDRRRILKALANSRISSRLTPSTSPAAVWGSVETFAKNRINVSTHVSMLRADGRGGSGSVPNSRAVGSHTAGRSLSASWGTQAPILNSFHLHKSSFKVVLSQIKPWQAYPATSTMQERAPYCLTDSSQGRGAPAMGGCDSILPINMFRYHVKI